MPDVTVPDTTLDAYWGPAQVRLYVDGAWIDDACGVQYQIRDSKTPKWGYFDQFFRTVARGQTIVQGVLSINFRFLGYLRSAVEKQIKRRSDFQRLTSSTVGLPRLNYGGLQNIANLTDAARLETLSAMAQGYPPNLRNETFDEWKDKIWGIDSVDEWDRMMDQRLEKPDVSSSEEIKERVDRRSYQRPGLFTSGFDITMIYGTQPLQQTDPGLIRVIQQVHLTGESQRVEIDVPDGGRAIREVYQFFARDVRAGEPNGAVPSSGGAAVR
jgi:hypothetical protein